MLECPYCKATVHVDTKINERIFYHNCGECSARMVVDLRSVHGTFVPIAIEGEREKSEARIKQLTLIANDDNAELVDEGDGTWDAFAEAFSEDDVPTGKQDEDAADSDEGEVA
jgi:hypothetical protein